MMLPNGWKKVRLGDVATISSGSTPLRSNKAYFENGNMPWVKTMDLTNGKITKTDECITELAAKKCKPYPVGTVLVAMYGGFNQIGRTGLLTFPASINQALAALQFKKDVCSEYVLFYLNANVDRWRSCAASSRKDPNITSHDVEKFEIVLPPIEEQKKIAATLSVWDSAIEKMEKLIETKENHFNQLMNKLIVINSSNSKWNTFALKNVFEVVNRKNKNGNTNILTSSAQYGLVNQQEYYKKKIASSNTSGYYLLKKGDFAYNRSYSTGYPYGVVKRLDKYELGVLSTLYLCFSLKKEYQSYSDFFVFLFESGYLNNQLALICREGARNHGLLNVSKEDFFNMKVQLPNEKEQQSIVCILHNHSLELSLLKQQLENYKKQKQGLMQKLLTGQWRVK